MAKKASAPLSVVALSIIDVILWGSGYGRSFIFIMIGVSLLFVAYKLYHIRSWARPVKHAKSVKLHPAYKDDKLLALASSRPVACYYTQGTIHYQPFEGWCAPATINTILASIGKGDGANYTHHPIRQYLRHISPLSLQPTRDVFHRIISHVVPAEGERSMVASIDVIPPTTYSDFLTLIRTTCNDPKYRYACNFLRGPLFFCDEREKHFWFRRHMFGHWSPLGAYISSDDITNAGLKMPTTESLDADSGDGYVLIHDVNESYGSYLVPVNRVWDAINTIDLSNGLSRGLIRVKLAC